MKATTAATPFTPMLFLIALLVATGFLWGLLWPQQVHAAEQVGEAVKVVRDVYGATLAKRMVEGEVVVANQRVRTGKESAVRLQFMDETELYMGERSELKLEKYIYKPETGAVESFFDMVRGVIRLSTGETKVQLTVNTPQGTIGVRGTQFDVYMDPQGTEATEVAVSEGTVEITTKDGFERVAAGQVYRMAKGEGAFTDGMSDGMAKAVTQMMENAGKDEAGKAAEKEAQTAAAVAGKDKANFVYLDTKHGRMVIELLPKLAPNHVKRFKELAAQGFYDGLIFHNVQPGYVVETGDPTGTGAGGSGQKLKAEFSKEPFVAGSVGMKRNQDDENSADSQFFIMLGRGAQLDNRYTLIGRVIQGLALTAKLSRGRPPKDPDQIISLKPAK